MLAAVMPDVLCDAPCGRRLLSAGAGAWLSGLKMGGYQAWMELSELAPGVEAAGVEVRDSMLLGAGKDCLLSVSV